MRGFVILAFFAVVVLGALFLLIKMSVDAKRERRLAIQEEADRNEERRREAEAAGALCAASLVHMEGLPLESGVPCVCCALPDSFVFVRHELKITLQFEKIQDAALRTRKELWESGKLSRTYGAYGDMYLSMLFIRDGNTTESLFLCMGNPEEARAVLDVFNKSPSRARRIEL